MNKLWPAIHSLLLLFAYVDLSEQFPFKNDEASQAELDRLISQAISRSEKEQPSKSEYERYYKVRQFLMQRIHKSYDSTTSTPIDDLETTTPRFFNPQWWFNQHHPQPFLDSNHKSNDHATFRSFPELKHISSWQA
jgi:hypothetical protein